MIPLNSPLFVSPAFHPSLPIPCLLSEPDVNCSHDRAWQRNAAALIAVALNALRLARLRARWLADGDDGAGGGGSGDHGIDRSGDGGGGAHRRGDYVRGSVPDLSQNIKNIYIVKDEF